MSRSRWRGSFWPDRTQRALLEIALGPGDQAGARWRALQPLDVTALEPGSFGLLPLLHEQLCAAGLGEPQLPRLAGTYRSIWYRNRLLLDGLATLLQLFREDEIDALLVGGAAVLVRWYPRLGLRPVMDMEFAVDSASFEHALSAAERAGWQASGTPHPFVRLRDDDGRALVLHPGVPAWLAGPTGRDRAYQILRSRAARLDALACTSLVLDAGDELLFVCAAGARAVTPRNCQWLVDAHMIIRTEKVPPAEELVGRARCFHLLEPLRATVAYLAELVGSDGLEEYLVALDAHPSARRDRLAFLLAGVGGRRAVAPAQVLAVHLQATADDSLLRVATRIPRTLQERWGAHSLLELVVLALKKTARLLRSEVQTDAAGRSRSASS